MSLRQAATCENAKNKRCRCRCQGRLHGAARLAPDSDRSCYELLPEDDAHRLERRGDEKGGTMLKTCRANFDVERDVPGEPLVIRDLGPWNRFMTITNDAEAVVEVLVERGSLPAGRRLFYRDSDGRLDEIVIREGKFWSFRALPQTVEV